jgi:NADPH:quinone reductase-like Zn-dependent oxidoreductase
MKAIQILKKKGRAIVNSIPIPKPAGSQILVEVHYSPIHPADLAALTGSYPEKEFPVTLGLEAAGLVVESENKQLIGKKVSLYNKIGCWSEYVIPDSYNILPDDMDLVQGSLLVANPFTAIAMRELSQGKPYIINTANSAVSRILIRNSLNQNPVCLVRNQKSKDNVLSEGAKYVLDTTSPSFKEEFEEVLKNNPCHNAFDFIGGDMTSVLLNSINKGGTVFILGNLGAQNINSIDPKELLFNRKVLRGVHLNDYMDRAESYIKQINHNIHAFHTEVASVVPYEKFLAEVLKYAKNMSGGKAVLKFK